MAIGTQGSYLLDVPLRQLPLAAALGAGALVFLVLAWHQDFLCDDAFISFRYARNWAQGLGLVFNPGESPPVEGYSNFLWVALLTPLSAAGLDLGTCARVLSSLCGLALVVWVPLHARRRLELDGLGTLATALFFASLPCTALWATGGLATMPFALALFGVYERLLGDPQRPRGLAAGGFGVVCVLLRADGFLWLGMLLGAAVLLAWMQRQERDGPSLVKPLLQASALIAVTFVAHVAWRSGYYGDWLPNTARVKAGLSSARLGRGFDYLAQWWLTLPGIALVLLGSLRRFPREERSLALASGALLLGGQAYAVWVGGDFMPFGRFLFAAVPFAALLFASLWKRLDARGPALGAAAAAGLIALGAAANFDLNAVPDSVRERFHFRLSSPTGWQSELAMRAGMVQRTAEWTERGRALELAKRPGDSIVLKGIGAIGYYADVFVFDCHGLVSPEVLEATEPKVAASPGHDREVPTTFFLNQRPTLGGAFFVAAGAPPEAGLPPGFAQHPLAKLLRVERHPLPAGDGFPPNSELRLLRFVRYP